MCSCLAHYDNSPIASPGEQATKVFGPVGAKVYTTAWHGNVVITSDGRTLQVKTERWPSLADDKVGRKTVILSGETGSLCNDDRHSCLWQRSIFGVGFAGRRAAAPNATVITFKLVKQAAGMARTAPEVTLLSATDQWKVHRGPSWSGENDWEIFFTLEANDSQAKLPRVEVTARGIVPARVVVGKQDVQFSHRRSIIAQKRRRSGEYVPGKRCRLYDLENRLALELTISSEGGLLLGCGGRPYLLIGDRQGPGEAVLVKQDGQTLIRARVDDNAERGRDPGDGRALLGRPACPNGPADAGIRPVHRLTARNRPTPPSWTLN